eukprot:CAMPEP_0178412896 /NCGR_PEP_ID=MMETSP0689_2-20121128/22251_1 /TAXON_ID=160604 /ORGANISM="Amphidinium massartii, Strain CS-259" /LENGTH=504 /DNA_ID=CAMNT_0020034157 /DNA_START=14 /DNA_END=1528 /DNA_ORIENTATION=+
MFAPASLTAATSPRTSDSGRLDVPAEANKNSSEEQTCARSQGPKRALSDVAASEQTDLATPLRKRVAQPGAGQGVLAALKEAGVLGGLVEEHRVNERKVFSLQSELAKAQAVQNCMENKQVQLEAAWRMHQESLSNVTAQLQTTQSACQSLEQELQLHRQKAFQAEEAMRKHQAAFLSQLLTEEKMQTERCGEMEERAKKSQQTLAEWDSKAKLADRQFKEAKQELEAAENAKALMIAKTTDVQKATDEAQAGTLKAEERIAAAKAALQAGELKRAKLQKQVMEMHRQTAELDGAAAEASTQPTRAGALGKSTPISSGEAEIGVKEHRQEDIVGTPAEEDLCNVAAPGSFLKKTAHQKVLVVSLTLPNLEGEYKLMDIVVNDRPAYWRQAGVEPMCLVWLHKQAPSAGPVLGMMGPKAGRHYAWAFVKAEAVEKAFGTLGSIPTATGSAASTEDGGVNVELSLPMEEVAAMSLQESWTAMPYEMARPSWWDGSKVERIAVLPSS